MLETSSAGTRNAIHIMQLAPKPCFLFPTLDPSFRVHAEELGFESDATTTSNIMVDPRRDIADEMPRRC